MSVGTLKRLYSKIGIRYRCVQVRYRVTEARQRRLEVERRAFAHALSDDIVSGRPIIYADESSFHLQMTQRRTWQLRGRPLSAPVNSKNERLTLYGAIGSCLRQQVVMAGLSTCASEFSDFLDLVTNNVIQPL